MIIYRYMSKEVLQTTFAVTLILILIIFSGRFSSYLADAASGRIDAGVLFTLLGLRMFNYFEVILPLGLLIGILLAYGRMYVDSEMTVLFSCGMSQSQLVGYTLRAAMVVAVVVSVFSLYLGPIGIKLSEQILVEQRNRTDFEAMQPEKFNYVDGGRGITYAESISSDKRELRSVFIARIDQEDEKGLPILITAKSGRTVIDPDSGGKFLLLQQGQRYLGRPGELNYEVVEFEAFSQRLPEPDYEIERRKATDGTSTLALLQIDTPEARAALHWRFSMPVLVLVLAVLAIPFSRTQPRAGRYAKLLPAIVVYLLYLVAANAAREEVELGGSLMIIWYVHLAFLTFAVLLLSGPWLGSRLRGG